MPNLCIISEFYPLGCLEGHFDWFKGLLDVLKLVYGMAKGLQFLHQLGVIHRDFAARNCLLFKNPNGEIIAKLTDFGMSRFSTKPVMQTQTNNFPLKWSAPEMFKFQYSQASDVWSWAITVIEVMNKGDPYPGITDMDAAIAVSENKLRPTIPEGVPTDMAALLLECWQFEPDKRPSFVKICNRMQASVAKLSKK